MTAKNPHKQGIDLSITDRAPFSVLPLSSRHRSTAASVCALHVCCVGFTPPITAVQSSVLCLLPSSCAEKFCPIKSRVEGMPRSLTTLDLARE